MFIFLNLGRYYCVEFCGVGGVGVYVGGDVDVFGLSCFDVLNYFIYFWLVFVIVGF